jgi:hypothetical protein
MHPILLAAVQFFRFDDGVTPAIVVFVGDLAARCHMEDEFLKHLPPRHDAVEFFDWCDERGLKPMLEQDEPDENLWTVKIPDPTIRFEFRMRWGN